MDLTVDEAANALVSTGTFAFLGAVPIERINEVAEALGVRFPAGYLIWLLKYGGGGATGAEISGIPLDAADDSVGTVRGDTQRLRDTMTLPDDLIVVLRNDDDRPWCLSTEPDEHGRCPVVSVGGGQVTPVYPDFDAFFAEYVIAWAQDIGADLTKHRPDPKPGIRRLGRDA